MRIACALQEDGDRPGPFIQIGERHAQHPMPSGECTPIADALPRAIEQRQDRLVAPRGRGVDQLFDEHRIEAGRQLAWYPPAQVPHSAPSRSVPTRHGMGIRPRGSIGRDRIGVPLPVGAVLLLAQIGKE